MARQEGEVFDLGYRRYDGPREGRARARQALFINGVRTCFGVGRGSWAKVLPILFFLSVMAPAAVLAALTGLFGELFADIANLPGPADYYQIVSPILLMFAAIIAPELLCPDRRDGVINLYLVRPMTPTDYVLGRWSAFFIVSLVFIYSGQVLLIAGLTLAASEPLEYFRDNWLDIPRSLGAGVAIALITTTIPLAAASFTTRRAYAAVAVIGLFIISTTTAQLLGSVTCTSVTSAVSETDGQSRSVTRTEVTVGPGGGIDSDAECEVELGEVGRWAQLIDLGSVQTYISDIIFGEYIDSQDPDRAMRLPAGVLVAWYVVVAAVPGFILWSRYRRLAR